MIGWSAGAVGYSGTSIEFEEFSLSQNRRCQALLAGNGKGKSTLSLFLAGVIPEAIWANIEMDLFLGDRRYLPLKSDLVRVIPQRWQHFSLGYSLESEAKAVSLVGNGSETWAAEVYEELAIFELSDRPQGVLSDGEKKRIQIALTIASHPKVIVSDEWDLHLDTFWRLKILELLGRLCGNGTTHLALVNSSSGAPDGYPLDLLSTLVVQQEEREHWDIAGEVKELTNRLIPAAAAAETTVDESVELPVGVKRVINIKASSGDLIEVVGRNGVGKSTLLRSLWNIFTSNKRFFWPPMFISSRQRGIYKASFVPADPIYQVLGPTVGDEIERCLRSHFRDKKQRRGLHQEVRANTFDLDVLALSFGQRKLLAILLALASGAPIVLLDEPFAGLDEEHVEVIKGAVELGCNHGKIVISAAPEQCFKNIRSKVLKIA